MTSQIEYETDSRYIKTWTPYHTDFIARARQLGGRWDKDCRCWRFPKDVTSAVLDALADVYGHAGHDRLAETKEDEVILRVTFGDGHDELRAPVIYGGIIIAQAYGRDSGARPGISCSVIEGSIDSGGSRNNWRTEIAPGTTFLIRGVPVSAAQRLINNPAPATSVQIIE